MTVESQRGGRLARTAARIESQKEQNRKILKRGLSSELGSQDQVDDIRLLVSRMWNTIKDALKG